mmetsp:Transcript_23761/g.60045  ORF Transcript_23761/g.60045 Transcript_23761/m.60045 type:complete len:209 (+) Transcript_23761:1846-2472(+)
MCFLQLLLVFFLHTVQVFYSVVCVLHGQLPSQHLFVQLIALPFVPGDHFRLFFAAVVSRGDVFSEKVPFARNLGRQLLVYVGLFATGRGVRLQTRDLGFQLGDDTLLDLLVVRQVSSELFYLIAFVLGEPLLFSEVGALLVELIHLTFKRGLLFHQLGLHSLLLRSQLLPLFYLVFDLILPVVAIANFLALRFDLSFEVSHGLLLVVQ